ncbi:Uu.00g030410.m01.CDS01 [Anthostomella pinea]|uniref:Uu.00g030410.m01.CDS01 n=1 Tax=Anthostomella pinea TaxID=933095 RepID=A0AAI8V8C3_9PEZI|nr:Uu.00g030410.m01.CDS01 [Anthostomella pinea]
MSFPYPVSQAAAIKSRHPRLEGDATRRTRKDVVQWAIDYGLVSTLENVDEVEDIASFFGTITTSSRADLELTPIHQAALCGHASVVNYLLKKGADVNAKTTNGLLPMHLARTGEVVQLLADHGGRSMMVPLHPASGRIQTISPKTAQRLPKAPSYKATSTLLAYFSIPASVQISLFRVEVSYYTKPYGLGQRDHGAEVAKTMATMLMDRGASPNSGLDSALDAWQGNEPCHTPTLFLADLVQLLLERGADQYMPYTRRRRRFYIAGRSIRGFEHAYDPSLVANLFAAMTDPGPRTPDPNGIRKLQLLIQYGGNIDTTTPSGDTLLQHSLRQDGSVTERVLEIIPHLIALGPDVTRIDSEGNSTLHLLLRRLSPLYSLIDMLVDRGADPNAKDAEGRTPLMHLHDSPTALLITALLRHSVDVEAVDKRSCNALHYATGEPADPFHDEPCFRLQVLLSHGNEGAAPGVETVNAYSESGRTLLHLLLEARYRPPQVVMEGQPARTPRPGSGNAHTSRRRRASANPPVIVRVYYGTTTSSAAGAGGGESPLHLAVQGHELEILLATRLLLRHGAAADINYVSPGQGLTPLMMVVAAAGRGELSRNVTEDMVGLLLAAGADAQMRDARGRTAWDVFVGLKRLTPVYFAVDFVFRTSGAWGYGGRRQPWQAGPGGGLTLSSWVV